MYDLRTGPSGSIPVRPSEEGMADLRSQASSSASSFSNHRLSHHLAGHTQDVKSLHCAALSLSHEAIFSVSRDSTARCWIRTVEGARVSEWVEGPTWYGGGRFLNAVTYVPRCRNFKASLLVGGLDALIRRWDVDEAELCTFINAETEGSASKGKLPTEEPDQIIQEHFDNVTSLHFYSSSSSSSSHRGGEENSLLLSTSWDTTARSFRRDKKGKWKLLHILKGHESAVWGGQVLSLEQGKEKYLTASADLFVRLYEGEEIKVVWSGRDDVVRSLTLLPPVPKEACGSGRFERDEGEPPFEEGERLFISTSNDPSLHVLSLSPTRRPPSIPTSGGPPLCVLDGHCSIVYDCTLQHVPASMAEREGQTKLQLPRVVTASEDGTVRVWNPLAASKEGRLVETIDVGPPVERAESEIEESEKSQETQRAAVANLEAAGMEDEDPPELVETPTTTNSLVKEATQTVWCVGSLPLSGDIVCGSQDGGVRVWTTRED